MSTGKADSPQPIATISQTLAQRVQGVGRRLSSVQVWKGVYGLDLPRRNVRYLEVEVFWAAFLSAAATFSAAFALRLGASNQEIGLLSSLPALMALLITIPSGHFLSRRTQVMPWLIRSLLLHRLGFLLVVLVPWLPFAAKGSALVWLLVLFTLPAHFFGVGWNSMLADAIPEVERTRVFAVRNGVSAIALTGGIYLAGLWLEYGSFPWNYQILYGAGFVTSLLSIFYIRKLQIPDQLSTQLETTLPLPDQPRRSPRQHIARWIRTADKFRGHADFMRIVLNTFLHGLGLWMVAPLYIIYFVRGLGANEGWLGLNGMLGNVTPVLGYYLWQRAIERWGEKPILKWTIVLVGVYPMLVGFSPSLAIILIWTGLNGLLVPAIGLSHFFMLLKICPDRERPLFMGVYTTIMNMGAAVMPLVGVVAADRFGIVPVLVVGGILAVIGSASFLFNPLRTEDSLIVRRGQTDERELTSVAT
jgi:MFS family permease